VLYLLLGIERWLFGYNFHYWQLASLLLHLGVCLLLYKIIREVHAKGPVPFLLTLLFGVQYFSMEMVIWHHMSGYLLFCLLFLYSFQQFRKFKNQPSWPNFFPLYIGLLLAAFTYEAGNAAAGWIAFYLLAINVVSSLRSNKLKPVSWKYPLLIFTIPLFYILLSALDYNYRFESFASGLHSLETPAINVIGVMQFVLFSSSLWLFSAFDPLYLILSPGERLATTGWVGLDSPLVILGVIPVILFAVGYAIRRARKRQLVDALPEISILIVMMLAFSFIIEMGRGTPRGIVDTLQGNPYYTYIFNLFAILLIAFTLTPIFNVARSSDALANVLMMVSLIIIIAFNARMTFAMNMAMLEYSKATWILVEKIEQLAHAHADDETFTFSVDASCKEDIDLYWYDLRDVPPKPFKAAEALYPYTYVEKNGKYVISCMND